MVFIRVDLSDYYKVKKECAMGPERIQFTRIICGRIPQKLTYFLLSACTKQQTSDATLTATGLYSG
jgi:hypothetical protein